MKWLVGILLPLLLCPLISADCTAPALSLKQHDGLLYGFRVERLQVFDDISAAERKDDRDTLIKSQGDYVLLAPLETQHCPVKVAVDAEQVIKQLTGYLQFHEYALAGSESPVRESWISGYDLTGDFRGDLILFHVTPGANVYLGAIGFVDGGWVQVIAPTCY